MDDKEKLSLIGHIDQAISVMQNYGFGGITRKTIIKNSGAINFMKGALRQQGLTESQIKDVEDYLQKEDEKSEKSDT